MKQAMRNASFLLLCAICFSTSADADAPDERSLKAPLVAPAAYSGTSTHTQGLAAWLQTPPEIAALARTLGAERLRSGAITADEYTLNVFNYVRSNISVEYRYGLGKGA